MGQPLEYDADDSPAGNRLTAAYEALADHPGSIEHANEVINAAIACYADNHTLCYGEFMEVLEYLEDDDGFPAHAPVCGLQDRRPVPDLSAVKLLK